MCVCVCISLLQDLGCCLGSDGLGRYGGQAGGVRRGELSVVKGGEPRGVGVTGTQVDLQRTRERTHTTLSSALRTGR